ncbi:MAG: DUF2975 domain-containing protein [Chloroflexota bacterium]
MGRLVIWLLRIGLLALVLVSVLAQLAAVALATEAGRRMPEVAHLVVPYSVAAVLFVGCGQVALLATWRLLSLVRRDAIFTSHALRWVDLVIGCGVVATALTAVVLAQMLFWFIPGGAGPVTFYLGAVVVAGAMFVLLMLVMRGLLQTAIADRTELDEVI